MLLGSKEDFHVPKKGSKKAVKNILFSFLFYSFFKNFFMNEIFLSKPKQNTRKLVKTPKNKKYKRPKRDSKASSTRD